MEDEERSVRSRPIWPWLLGMTMLLVIALVAWFAWPRDPSPARVMIAVHGCSGECASALAGALRGQLSETFDVVGADHPIASADEAPAAAASHGAAHALFVDVETHERRDASEREAAYASATVRAHLVSASGEPARELRALRIGAFGADADTALRTVVLRSAETLAASINVALLERPSVVTYTTETVGREEEDRQSAIREQLTRLERVREEISWMDESCREAATELARDGGNTRCLSHACAEEYAFDVLADGSSAIVHGETPGASIAIARPLARRIETEETLAIVPLDGSAPRVIGRSDNYYTYPDLSADGRRVVAVEDWGREFGLVVIDVEDAARTVISRSRNWVQSPRISPDGAFILYHSRAERRAPPQLVVVEARAGATERLIGEARLATWVDAGGPKIAELVEWARVGAPPSLEPIDPLAPPVIDELPVIESTMRLALHDPRTGEPGLWLDDERHEIEELAGTWDGKIVFTWSNGDVCGVGVWDPTGPVIFTRTQICIDHPSATADGHVVGTARASAEGDPSPDDDEIVDVSLVDGAHRVLTSNALRDRYPRAAGDRVVFDRIGTSRYRTFPRVATCWLTRGE
jgi:hypothetical protein